MAEISQEKLLEIEERKLALEERRETNRFEEAKRAHDLALAESAASAAEPLFDTQRLVRSH